MATFLDAYKQWSAVQDAKILDYFDPSGRYKLSPTQDYPLTDFTSAFAIVVAYLAFVVFGTLIMKAGFPAINTSAIQFLYNPLQVLLCSYMSLESLIQAYRHNYTMFPCNAYDAKNPVMGNVLYLFYLSKIFDFMDTFFIIAGKKWKQLSFLHVYHHASIFFFYYINSRVTYDGDIYLTIVLNGFIHTIMYMYYFVSSHTKNIWWKKYLTSMQLIQFFTMNIQSYYHFTTTCSGSPDRITMVYFVYIQSLFWLFMNFFIKNYCAKPRKSVSTTKKEE